MSTVKGLGPRMRAARKRAGLSLEQVAGHPALGVSIGAVAQWETERTTPDLDNFVGFCSATKASPTDLLGMAATPAAGKAERLQSLLARLGEQDLDMAIALISRLSPLSPAEKRFYRRAAKTK